MAINFTENYVTTAVAAERLGLTQDTVKRYCNSDPQRIRGEKIGSSWMIPESAIEEYKDATRDKRGRPRNSQYE